ncbi:hypothetical protein [Dyella sp. ASV21]|jgi:hypothetical protein|uniref:hypothetical protein n=1 Tax=Dyella sp. ASV21 TaxID=2795114 RepID=UPI001E5FF025|nr:hypothetical protein [Dyella sp. ASV21]
MDDKRVGGSPWCRGGWLASTVLLAACASAPSNTASPRPATEVDAAHRAADRGEVAHYELALGQVSTGAVPREHPAPVYPVALREARLPPQEISARLIVDAQGRVSEVCIDGANPADPLRSPFDAAIRAAALQWTFEPLMVSQWAADANGNTHEVGRQAQPFRFDVVFRFAWKDGKPVTGADAAILPQTPALGHSGG